MTYGILENCEYNNSIIVNGKVYRSVRVKNISCGGRYKYIGPPYNRAVLYNGR